MIRRHAGGGRVMVRVLISGVALVLATAVALANLAPAQAVLRVQGVSLAYRIGVQDAVIKSSPDSNASFVACHNWAEVDCQDAAADRLELAPGQNTWTAFGWKDADGLLIAEGCTMQISRDHRAEVFTGPRWFKVVGLLGLTQELTYTCSH